MKLAVPQAVGNDQTGFMERKEKIQTNKLPKRSPPKEKQQNNPRAVYRNFLGSHLLEFNHIESDGLNICRK